MGVFYNVVKAVNKHEYTEIGCPPFDDILFVTRWIKNG